MVEIFLRTKVYVDGFPVRTKVYVGWFPFRTKVYAVWFPILTKVYVGFLFVTRYCWWVSRLY